MKFDRPILLILPWMLAACSPGKPAADRQQNAPLSFSQRLNQDQGYVRDKEGNWVPKTNKRSPFESQGESAFSKRDKFDHKSFDPGRFDRKPWQGQPEVARTPFETKADPQFSGRDAGLAKPATIVPDNRTVDTKGYATQSVDTADARENAGKRLEKPSDAETDVRRRVYPQPEVIDYQQLRQMSIDEARGMLGR